MTHAFHAALFAIIIRYSTLAGGQQLNVLRGGGMQGAIHDTSSLLLIFFKKEKEKSSASFILFPIQHSRIQHSIHHVEQMD